MPGLLATSLFRARRFGVQIYALFLAARDPRTPWHVRIMGLLLAAYLLSPLDFIPEIVPFLGLVDDLVIVPLGLKAVSTLIPLPVQQQAETRARSSVVNHPQFWRIVGAVLLILVLIWIAILIAIIYLLVAWLR